MMTDRQIRKFMQDNRIPVPKDDRFMAELVRQIDLLPHPSALNGSEEGCLMQNILLVKAIRKALKKHLRRKAYTMLAVNAALFLSVLVAAAVMAGYMDISLSAVGSLQEWICVIAAVLSVCSLAISFRITEI